MPSGTYKRTEKHRKILSRINARFWLGKKLPEKHRQNISNALKGKKFSEQHKRNISKGSKGKIITWGDKISEALKGRIFSESHRKKLGEANRRRIITDETRKKMSKAHKGNKNALGGVQTEENKRKISERMKGQKYFLGHHHTEESKRKLSESHQGEKCANWQGGISFFPYDSKFNRALKKRIRERDNYICQMPRCGIKENGRAHDVHHIDYEKTNSTEGNLITLCFLCHLETGTKTKKDYYTKLFRNLKNEVGNSYYIN